MIALFPDDIPRLIQVVLVLIGIWWVGDRLRLCAAALVMSLAVTWGSLLTPEMTIPLGLIGLPLCTMWAAREGSHVGNVIALFFLSRLICYAVYSVGVISLPALWATSDFFLWAQIAVLYMGASGGGLGVDHAAMGDPRRR